MTEEDAGERTKKTRIGGRSVNAAKIKAAALRVDWSDKTASQQQAGGLTDQPATIPFPTTPADDLQPPVGSVGSQ
jgi:hypothetical protein